MSEKVILFYSVKNNEFKTNCMSETESVMGFIGAVAVDLLQTYCQR